jgi:hypothetical protein
VSLPLLLITAKNKPLIFTQTYWNFLICWNKFGNVCKGLDRLRYEWNVLNGLIWLETFFRFGKMWIGLDKPGCNIKPGRGLICD